MALALTHRGLRQEDILSPALEPIPKRLVQCIRSDSFVDMREPLSDNVALHDHLEAMQGSASVMALQAGTRPWQQEVPSLISWVYCFLAYIAVQTSDTATWDMLTYCRLIYTPLSVDVLSDLIKISLKHDFISALLVVAGGVMTLHYTTLITLFAGCPVAPQSLEKPSCIINYRLVFKLLVQRSKSLVLCTLTNIKACM